jgi:hypothetical protein
MQKINFGRENLASSKYFEERLAILENGNFSD